MSVGPTGKSFEYGDTVDLKTGIFSINCDSEDTFLDRYLWYEFFSVTFSLGFIILTGVILRPYCGRFVVTETLYKIISSYYKPKFGVCIYNLLSGNREQNSYLKKFLSLSLPSLLLDTLKI